MSILTASQNAIAYLVGRRPASVVSSTDEIAVEMTTLAQEAGTEIAKANDWTALTEFHEITADGVSETYPFPEDYDRMVQASEFYDPNNWCWNYRHITNFGEWIQIKNGALGVLTPGMWTIRKKQFHFYPVPAAGQKATFAYISNNIFEDENGAPKPTITSDADVYVLNERLLTLCMIWKWLALKRMDYQQEIADYNLAFTQEATRDKGARVIRKRNRYHGFDLRPAWPWPLGGV